MVNGLGQIFGYLGFESPLSFWRKPLRDSKVFKIRTDWKKSTLNKNSSFASQVMITLGYLGYGYDNAIFILRVQVADTHQ